MRESGGRHLVSAREGPLRRRRVPHRPVDAPRQRPPAAALAQHRQDLSRRIVPAAAVGAARPERTRRHGRAPARPRRRRVNTHRGGQPARPRERRRRRRRRVKGGEKWGRGWGVGGQPAGGGDSPGRPADRPSGGPRQPADAQLRAARQTRAGPGHQALPPAASVACPHGPARRTGGKAAWLAWRISVDCQARRIGG